MIRLVGKSKFRLLSLFILFSLILTGCGSDFASPYSTSVLASEMAGRGFTADLRADAFAKDLCVIVGAQGYTGTAVPDMSSRLGKFDYYPETDGTNLFLLVDHIYAGLQFNMTLDEDYAALRDIKVKNILLKPENAGNDVVEAVDAVVTIAANNTNQSPLSVAFPTNSYKKGKNPEPAVLYDGKAKSLSTDSPTFMACLCPGANTKFTLETTYDVYDRKGNIIREGETVRNAISLDYDLEAGKLHTVNIKVMPTYLYVLSDPDLESPTFVVVN